MGYSPWIAKSPTLQSKSQAHWATSIFGGFPGGASDKEPTCQCREHKRQRWGARQPIPVFLSGDSHGQRSLVGYSP